MKDKNIDRETDLSFSYLIACLYGESKGFREIKRYHNLVDAKKYFLKIIKSIRFAIEETIKITDNHHKRELLDTINNSEKSIKLLKDFDSLDQKMISFQSELIFLLIGGMPRWSIQQRPNRRGSWNFSGFRQIQYVQNSEHKGNIILSAVQSKKERFGSWSDFSYDIWFKQCHRDPDELILWFKKNHPDIYYDLFDP